MAFRQLPVAGLLAAVLALPSCDDGEPKKVAISLGVDADSCGTEGNLAIQCSSELWVSVEGATGQILSSDCLTLGEQRQSIENLGQLLSTGSSLGTLATDQPLRISLKVYQSMDAVAPCQSGAPNGGVPYIEGSTPLVTLGEVSEDISLLLRCGEPVVPPDGGPGDEECTNCGVSLEQCLADAGVSSCQDVQANCQASCQDLQSECQGFCDLTEQFCQGDEQGAGLLQLNCSGLSKNCREQCPANQGGEDDCDAICNAIDSSCTNSSNSIVACQEQSQPCPNDCEQPNSCLTL